MRLTGELREIKRALNAYVAALEPDQVSVVYAAQVFEELVAIERLATSAMTLLARRVEAAQGCRHAAESLAKPAGTSVSAAKRMLETSKQLEDLPVVTDALRDGVLSAPAAEVLHGPYTRRPRRTRTRVCRRR